MVLGDRNALAHEARDLRSYDGHRSHRQRFNYKMTDMQAALGRAQLARLPDFVRRRQSLASRYEKALAGGPWELPINEPHHIYYRFVIQVHGRARRFLSRLDDLGIEARRPVFKPLHRYLGLGGFPGTDEAFRRAVSIPLYPALTNHESLQVIEATQRAGVES
jgi:perosamine synthetase